MNALAYTRAEILCATKHFQAFIQNHKAREKIIREKIKKTAAAAATVTTTTTTTDSDGNTATTTNELKYAAKSCVLFF